MFLISKQFLFDSAHYLPRYKGKCENMHGHTYRIEVTLKISELNDGLAFDFVELKKIVKAHIIDEWDHQLINDYIENPSAEHMCMYAWEKLCSQDILGKKLYEIKIWETPTSCATYRGSKGRF